MSDPSEFDAMSAVQLRDLIARREVSPVEVTRRALMKAEATQAPLNAFVLIMAEQAMAAAVQAEQAVMLGDPLGPLHGVPLSVKDMIAVGGVRLTFGSRTIAENMPGADAPAVQRAKKAGAI